MTREDAAAVNDLLAAAEAVDRTDEHYNLDDVLEDFDNPMIDPAKDWLLVELDGQVVAHSRLMPRAPADGALSVGLDGTVRPSYRRQGIGSQLVPAPAGAGARVRARARRGPPSRRHGQCDCPTTPTWPRSSRAQGCARSVGRS